MVSYISHTPNFRSKMDLLTLLKDCRFQTFGRHSSTDFVCITCLRWTQPCAWKPNIFHGLLASSWMTVHLHRRARVLLLFLMPILTEIQTLLAISPAIFLNTLVPSLSLKNHIIIAERKSKWEQLLCETGNGDYGTSKGAHFLNSFSDRAEGTIAIVLGVLTDTILFSRRVIVIQKYAINMTVDMQKKG